MNIVEYCRLSRFTGQYGYICKKTGNSSVELHIFNCIFLIHFPLLSSVEIISETRLLISFWFIDNSFLLSLGVFLYGGSVTASQIAVMVQTNLRPAHLVTAPLASSSVKMVTAPTPASSAMATQIALMVQTRMRLSAV